MNKNNNFKLSAFKYLVFFIFFFLLFFGNNIEVKAASKGSGGGSFSSYTVEITSVGEFQKAGERRIIDDRTAFDSDIGAFHYGQTEKMVKYMNQYKSMIHEGKISNQYSFITYCRDVLKLRFEGEIIAYPDCMVVEEYVKKLEKNSYISGFKAYNIL